MKNEGPFILEWIAFHQSIGFDHFLVYTNDCDDGTDRIFDRLAELGICTHLPNPAIGNQRPQAAAMRDIVQQPLFRQADWFLFSDCDEFLNIHLGENSLDDLIDAMGDAKAISVIWRLFGTGGNTVYRDVPVIEDFTRAAPHFCPHPPQAWGFKTLFQPEGGENIDRLGAHRPFFRDESGLSGKWLGSGGQPIEDWLIKAGWRFNRNNYSYEWAQLNHYAVRSADSFLVKSDRGHVLHTHKDIDFDYFRTMNQNAREDRSVLTQLPRFRSSLNTLLDDGVLADLHAVAVEWHASKARQIRSDNPDLAKMLEA